MKNFVSDYFNKIRLNEMNNSSYKVILTFDEDISKKQEGNIIKYGSIKQFFKDYPILGKRKFTIIIDNNSFDFELARYEIGHINNINQDISLKKIKEHFSSKSSFIALLNSLNKYDYNQCLIYLEMHRDTIFNYGFAKVDFPLVTYQDSQPLNINEPKDIQFILEILIQQFKMNPNYIDFSIFKPVIDTEYDFELAFCQLICNIEGMELFLFNSEWKNFISGTFTSRLVLYENERGEYLVII